MNTQWSCVFSSVRIVFVSVGDASVVPGAAGLRVSQPRKCRTGVCIVRTAARPVRDEREDAVVETAP